MVEPGDRLSVSVGQDDYRAINDFDEYFEGVDDGYNRSDRIKEAMAFYQRIHELCQQFDYVDPDEMHPVEFKSVVHDALRDRLAAESRVE